MSVRLRAARPTRRRAEGKPLAALSAGAARLPDFRAARRRAPLRAIPVFLVHKPLGSRAARCGTKRRRTAPRCGPRAGRRAEKAAANRLHRRTGRAAAQFLPRLQPAVYEEETRAALDKLRERDLPRRPARRRMGALHRGAVHRRRRLGARRRCAPGTPAARAPLLRGSIDFRHPRDRGHPPAMYAMAAMSVGSEALSRFSPLVTLAARSRPGCAAWALWTALIDLRRQRRRFPRKRAPYRAGNPDGMRLTASLPSPSLLPESFRAYCTGAHRRIPPACVPAPLPGFSGHVFPDVCRKGHAKRRAQVFPAAVRLSR